MEPPVGDGTLLWEPSGELKQQATLTLYMHWLEREKGLHFRDQEELWQWSVSHLEDFWVSIWDFFSVKASRLYTSVLADRKMPGAQWFPGAELNYAEQVFRNASPDRPALLFQSERHPLMEVSWEALSHKVGSVANALRTRGVQRGDRVGTLLPNGTAFLAVWLGCAEAGATLVPINVNLTGDMLRYIVEHADLHTLIVDRSVLPAFRAAFGEAVPALLVGDRVPLQVQGGEETLHGKRMIYARAEEIGDNQGEIDATVEGDAAKIAFNGKYLQDVLSVLAADRVALETSIPSSPGVIRPIGGKLDEYVHVVMPMFVQW